MSNDVPLTADVLTASPPTEPSLLPEQSTVTPSLTPPVFSTSPLSETPLGSLSGQNTVYLFQKTVDVLCELLGADTTQVSQ